jgi:hypothetical protein
MKQIQSGGRSAGFALMLPLAALFSTPIGAADSFSVLAGGAVTCTDSDIIGDVGAGTALTQTRCTISGSAHVADAAAAQAYADLLGDYDALGAAACDRVLTGTLAGVTLAPGVYCFDAAAALTGTLTLRGSANGTWLFLVGTGGTGALTATNLSIVTSGGADACNVTWWVAQDATVTTSNFVGTILAGADITVTGGTYDGDVLSGGGGSTAIPTGAVTMTGTDLAGCESTSSGGGGNSHQRCNQGVGNGPETCDPGNSNQGDPDRSNDERGGVPGSPGRKP